MYLENLPGWRLNRLNTSGYTRPNLSGQHRPISKSSACEIMEKMRVHDTPSKVLRFGLTEIAKPARVPESERTKAMLQRYNTYSQYHHYIMGSPEANDTPGKSRKKEEGFRIAKWVSDSLPLSRSEAKAIGCTDIFIPLAARALGHYGPWQTQVLRHVNFPLISQEVLRYRSQAPSTILMSVDCRKLTEITG